MTTELALNQEVEELLQQMTLKEKLHQMSGDFSTIATIIPEMLVTYNSRPIPAGENKRLGIPPILFADGPRGIVCGQSTCFPVSMARGASWDIDLEERVGDAIGVEMRSQGGNYFGGVCINLLRHPAWGRAQETYGEDTVHVGEFGAALVRGVQRHGMACIKHFAVNSIENARFKLDVQIDERALREVYLPHFKRCIDEGAASVMSAYNKMNGERCSESSHLLRKILKDEWRFDGFVISDFLLAIRSATKAVRGGMDIEMPYKWHYGWPLSLSLKLGRSCEQDVNESVRRILKKKLEFKEVGEPERYSKDAILCDTHKQLALEAAEKSIVLLKNEKHSNDFLLPLDINKGLTIAVIGRLAKYENIGDHGSSMVRPPKVVTPLEGLEHLCHGSNTTFHYNDGKDINSAKELAKGADVVLVFAGYTYKDEGEYIIKVGGDRDSLSLKAHDETLIKAISKVNKKTVVTMFGGSAIVTEAWRHEVPAMLMAWYPGQAGGTAIAKVLFGKTNPSAKLPCSFPRSDSELPFFSKSTRFIRYEYLQGYRYLEHHNYAPAFPFGFGLSYSQFRFSNLKLESDRLGTEDTLNLSVDVENLSELDGEEVVQAYISYPQSVFRAEKDLKAFAKVKIKAGEKQSLNLNVSAEQLRFYDEGLAKWTDELGNYQVLVGNSSAKEDLLVSDFTVSR